MLSIISAPASAPQTTVPPPPQPRPAPRLDDTDREIISLVREHGPVKIWTVLDRVAESKGAQSRVEARSYRLRLWHYWVKRLMWLKLIYPVGRNELVAVKPDTQSTRRGPRRRKPSVARLPHVQGGSAINPEAQAQELETKHPVGSQVDKREKPRPSAPADLAETESDAVTKEQASEAGRLLTTRPRRQQHKWTGWLRGEHFWRGRPVVLPNGEVTGVYWTSRGRVLLEDANDLPDLPLRVRLARRKQDVRIYRDPAAIVLGRLKAGVKEAPSALKASSARANGCKPCRPGRRPRGRPRRSPLLAG
jgi:hypothetical protein